MGNKRSHNVISYFIAILLKCSKSENSVYVIMEWPLEKRVPDGFFVSAGVSNYLICLTIPKLAAMFGFI